MFDLEWILSKDEPFRYQLLGRMKMDCEYYLGNGNKNRNQLWTGNETEQIEYIKALWNSFPEEGKPEWLTYEQILEFEEKMTNSTASKDSVANEEIN